MNNRMLEVFDDMCSSGLIILVRLKSFSYNIVVNLTYK